MVTKKLLAVPLAASMLHSTLDSGLTKQVYETASAAEQERIIRKGVEMLQKIGTDQIHPMMDESSYTHHETRIAAGDPQTEVTIQDVHRYFTSGAPEKPLIDMWVFNSDYREYSIKHTDEYSLDKLWEQVQQAASVEAIRNPHADFRTIFLRAITKVNPQKQDPKAALRWKTYDFHTPPPVEGFWQHMAITREAYPLFQPMAALAELDYFPGHIDSASATTGPDGTTVDEGTNRINNLFGLRNAVMHSRELQDRIKQAAREANLPTEDLAYLVYGYLGSMQDTTLPAQRREQSQQRQPFAMDVERMTLGLLPHLRDIYHSGVDAIIVADRGARPLGTIVRYVQQQAALPAIDVVNIKFAQAEKLIESYAATEDATFTAEEKAVLRRNAELRRKEKQLRRNGTDSSQLASDLERATRAAAPIYQRHKNAVTTLQQDYAKELLNGKTSAVVIDDWVKTGKTRENIYETLEAIGIDVHAVLSLVNTPKASAAVYTDANAIDKSYCKKTGWMETLPWHQMTDATGITYGTDAGATSSSKLFAKLRTRTSYQIPAPKEYGYSTEEINSIFADLAKHTLVDESVPKTFANMKQEVQTILSSYRRTEGLEAVQLRINTARAKYFTRAIREGVDAAVKKISRIYGEKALHFYITGAAVPSLEYAINGVVSELREA